MACDPAILQEIQLFELLSPKDRRALADVVGYRQIPAGTVLFRAGDPGESLFVVRAGEIELSIKDNLGQKITLAHATSGEIFGELALLEDKPRTATAVAEADSELVELERDHLLMVFKKNPESALRMLGAMGHMTRKADDLLRSRVSRNVNEEVAEQLTIVQKVSDWLAWFSGSVQFLVLHIAWFIVWVSLNTWMPTDHFDPFPFGLLTMIVSLEAIFLSCFVLISQNRQVEKDRVRGDIEYDVNIKAELEVAHLHEKMDNTYAEMMSRFSRLEKMLGASQVGVGKSSPAKSADPIAQ
jgi:CRP/FNR family transcriptional regulator, cyclic AMP receptor protein